MDEEWEGKRVVLQGLAAALGLNGREGVVSSALIEASGRYEVQLSAVEGSAARTLSVKPANLELAEHGPEVESEDDEEVESEDDEEVGSEEEMRVSKSFGALAGFGESSDSESEDEDSSTGSPNDSEEEQEAQEEQEERTQNQDLAADPARAALVEKIRCFAEGPDAALKLSASLRPKERLMAHQIADTFNLNHASAGTGKGRHLVLSRKGAGSGGKAKSGSGAKNGASKKKVCRAWLADGKCPNGAKCQFTHSKPVEAGESVFDFGATAEALPVVDRSPVVTLGSALEGLLAQVGGRSTMTERELRRLGQLVSQQLSGVQTTAGSDDGGGSGGGPAEADEEPAAAAAEEAQEEAEAAEEEEDAPSVEDADAAAMAADRRRRAAELRRAKEEAAAAALAEEMRLLWQGKRVVLQGLKAGADLNGREGLVSSALSEETGRYEVQLSAVEASGAGKSESPAAPARTLSVKPENLSLSPSDKSFKAGKHGKASYAEGGNGQGKTKRTRMQNSKGTKGMFIKP
jgi:hypothetical protein